MALSQIYRVIYHWEKGGTKTSHEVISYVDVAANDYNTLRNVIVTNQSQSHGSDTLVIDTVANVMANVWQ